MKKPLNFFPKGLGREATRAVAAAIEAAGLSAITKPQREAIALDAGVILPNNPTPAQTKKVAIFVERVGMLAATRGIMSNLAEGGHISPELATRGMVEIMRHRQELPLPLSALGITGCILHPDGGATIETTRGSHELSWLPQKKEK